jgi:transcription elongation factor Elf1
MPDIIKCSGFNFARPSTVSFRCPACTHVAVFDPLVGLNDVVVLGYFLGQRRCPNVACNAHVFVVLDSQQRLLATYPPVLLDFDAENIPAQLVATFQESLTCHANECYTAAAMMVRKTLEQLCLERGATGQNLKQRIADLRTKVILPSALLDAADSLRLLGNDAAHIEAQTYNDVGKKEVELAIALTREIMKSLYQYQGLLEQLNSLKK